MKYKQYMAVPYAGCVAVAVNNYVHKINMLGKQHGKQAFGYQYTRGILLLTYKVLPNKRYAKIERFLGTLSSL